MNKQELATKIWDMANKMRAKIEPNEYKDIILGFLFYKFLSDKQEKSIKALQGGEQIFELFKKGHPAIQKVIKDKLGYLIPYHYLFSYWRDPQNRDNSKISNISEGLNSFDSNIAEGQKDLLKGIFNNLGNSLDKLGDNSGVRTTKVHDIFEKIDEIPIEEKHDFDVLGFVYEFLISRFAASAGKKAGEFYTPHEVSVIMSDIVAGHLKNKKEIKIFDPTSGSGSLLINIGKSITKAGADKNKIQYWAQELIQSTYDLTRMNLLMRGITPSNIHVRNADTLKDDWPLEENDPLSGPIRVDAVVSNPPYSAHWEPEKVDDPRFKDFGLAPKTKADFAFLLHDLYHLNPDGILCIVLPHGVLFRGAEEGKIRKALVEKNHIDAIIGLPPQIFYGTGIPTIIMVLRQHRPNTDVLFIDASKGFKKEGKLNILRSSDIRKIVETYQRRLTIQKYSRKVSLEEIIQNGFNLNIPRYVDSSEPEESLDLFSMVYGGIPKKEIEKLEEYWEVFPSLKTELFSEKDDFSLKLVNNSEEVIRSNKEILEYKSQAEAAIDTIQNFFKQELIESLAGNEVDLDLLQEKLFQKALSKVAGEKLFDKYAFYQNFVDVWQTLERKIEIISQEGLESAKKRDLDTSVQIIPDDLVLKTYFNIELDEITQKENDFEAKIDQIKTNLENLEEEEKVFYLPEDLNIADLSYSQIKEIKKKIEKGTSITFEIEFLKDLKSVSALESEKRKLRVTLNELMIQKFKDLSEAEIKGLLEILWIQPLMAGLKRIFEKPEEKIQTWVKKQEEKYANNLTEVSKNLQETNSKLLKLVSELNGDPSDLKALSGFVKFLESGNEG